MEQKEKAAEKSLQDADDEINLFDVFYSLFRHRKFIVIFCFVVTAATGFYTLRMPNVYEVTAVTLPEVSQSSGGSDLQAAFLANFGITGFGGSKGTPAEVFQSILKSEDLAHQALKRSGGYFRMGMSSTKARKVSRELVQLIDVGKAQKEPTLSLSIQSTDPVIAADLANTYLVELDIYNQNSGITSAQRLRKYIVKRLEAANIELEQAQKELRQFQEKSNAVSISDQARATIEVLSEMEAKRVALGVEKEATQMFYKGSSIELEKIDAQINALQKNIDRLTFSTEDKITLAGQEGKVEFYIPLTKIPSLSFDESRLILNVKAKTGVVTMLTNQMEQAKLDETKDMPTINVLDWAAPPDKPVKPNLKLNILLGAVGSLILAVLITFVREYFRVVQQDSEIAPKLQEIKEGLLPARKLWNRRGSRHAKSHALT